MSSLEEIANADTTSARTDKGEHGYLDIYERLFAHLRDTKLPILELGVWKGGSLVMWREWFTRAEIHGVDLRPCPDLGPRIHVHHGNICDPGFMSEITALGPFAVIIDDAAHCGDEQAGAWCALWPALAKGGLYVIEDLHAAFYPEFQPSVLPFLFGLTEQINHYEDSGIGSLHFYPKLFVAERA